MSTRALIAVPKDDGIHYVYCHHDGYPSGLGAVLHDHYNSFESACAILDLGNLSGLDPDLNASVFYCRDRGEPIEDNCAIVVADTDELYAAEQDCDAEYCYLWDLTNNCWICRDTKTRIERSL